ncbi:MAG: hypothetical protein GY810_09800 [Aureispira sp.]|nr:hypothetical protein [Aureispira sp.]
MNDDILDSVAQPKSFLNEHAFYRYLVGLIWFIFGAMGIFKGLRFLYLFSEGTEGLFVLFDPTPRLFQCLEPITLGGLCFVLSLAIVFNSNNRPKLILLYLSISLIFLIQEYSYNEIIISFLPFIPFLGVFKLKLSLGESLFAIFLSLGLLIFVWIVQDTLPLHINEARLTFENLIFLMLILFSIGKYLTDINSLSKIEITIKHRLFLFISATPWVLSIIFEFFELNKGGKWFDISLFG